MNRIPKISKRLGFFHITFDNYSKNLHKNYSNVSTEKFETVYKFPYILPLSMVNRLKYYQTVVTVSFLPTSALIYKMNYLDIEMLKIIGSLGKLSYRKFATFTLDNSCSRYFWLFNFVLTWISDTEFYWIHLLQ